MSKVTRVRREGFSNRVTTLLPARAWPYFLGSALTDLHQQTYRARVDPALNEKGLLPYMARVFIGGLVWPPARSQSLMPPLEKK